MRWAMQNFIITLSLVLITSCGGATADGVPEDCEISVDGECYDNTEEACAAADCPRESCTILRSYPGQVDCGE